MQQSKAVILVLGFCLIVAMFLPTAAYSQAVPVSWDATKYFKYNIERVAVDDGTGNRMVAVDFSVSNPTTGGLWNILVDAPFKQAPSLSRLAIDIGWPAVDYQNTGAAGEALLPLVFGAGRGAALPISVDALKQAVPLGGNKFQVTVAVPSQAQGTGVVAIEGHPAWQTTVNGVYDARVPVKNAYQYFPLTTGAGVVPRREIVDINKCKVCHDGKLHQTGVIPRLSLHGENRTEELHVCVICHNPNQTDIPYRTVGPEVSIDFKRMVHAIHAGGFRNNPFMVTGRQGTVYDFSGVRFPAELSNCVKCHIDNGRGSFELPLPASVRGSTIETGSFPGVSIDVDPANDWKITPTAAVCSSCHDSRSAISHMSSTRSGGNFRVRQSDIDGGKVRERCASCHGPGRDEDVRRVHEIGRTAGRTTAGDD